VLSGYCDGCCGVTEINEGQKPYRFENIPNGIRGLVTVFNNVFTLSGIKNRVYEISKRESKQVDFDDNINLTADAL